MNELYIGFMSGTSLDGVDASLIRTNGVDKFTPIENIHISYPTKIANMSMHTLLQLCLEGIQLFSIYLYTLWFL